MIVDVHVLADVVVCGIGKIRLRSNPFKGIGAAKPGALPVDHYLWKKPFRVCQFLRQIGIDHII
jgi:hypothetical protein